MSRFFIFHVILYWSIVTNTMRMKFMMKRMRVIVKVIHSEFRRTEENNSKEHLQNFKKHLIYIHNTLRIYFVD